jgi:glycosyltransferase involved in cell wall biosynthesis
MASGLPVVSTQPEETGTTSKSKGGIVVPFNDPKSVHNAIKRILNNDLFF